MSAICISSGHGKYVRGASGIIDEVDEARKVVDRLAEMLAERGVNVMKFHDNTSTSQSQNLNAIVNWHNSKSRDLDVSVHFNAYEQVTKPMGTEVLYVTQKDLAAELADAIASVGFINRGAKKRTDLKFLNSTHEPAVMLEVCFVDSQADCDIYGTAYLEIVDAIATVLSGEEGEIDTEPFPPASATFYAIGRCSHFGGPDDMGVSDSEGLAFLFDVQDKPHVFLPEDTPGTEGKGLARRLNPHTHYIACRWDYNRTPKAMLAGPDVAMVKALETGLFMVAHPADWGPNEATGRIADISPSLMYDLQITTDCEVEVIYPWTGE